MKSLIQSLRDKFGQTNQFTTVGINDSGGGGGYRLPVPVSDSKLQIPAQIACVNLLSGLLAASPMHAVRKAASRDKSDEILFDHPIAQLLERPDPELEGYLFWETVFERLVMTGNSYVAAIKSRIAPDQTVSMRMFNPTRYRPNPANLNQEHIVYGNLITNPPRLATEVVMPNSNLMAFRGTGFSQNLDYPVLDSAGLLKSPSPIMEYARRTIELYLSAHRGQKRAVEKGSHIPFTITTDVNIPPKKFAELSELIFNANKSDDRYRLLPPHAKVEKIGFSNVDLQIIDLLNMTDKDIALCFQVPLELLPGISREKVIAPLETVWTNFLRTTLNRWRKRIESTLELKLLPPGSGLKIMLDFTSLERMGAKDTAEVINLLVQRTGVITPNEGRQRLGLSTLQDPEADKLRSPTGAPAQGQAQPSGE